MDEKEKRRRGKPLSPLSADAPLYARKVRELLKYYDVAVSSDKFARRIGTNRGTFRRWAIGEQEPDLQAKLAIKGALGIPADWWDTEGVPIEVAIAGTIDALADEPTLPVLTSSEEGTLYEDILQRLEERNARLREEIRKDVREEIRTLMMSWASGNPDIKTEKIIEEQRKAPTKNASTLIPHSDT